TALPLPLSSRALRAQCRRRAQVKVVASVLEVVVRRRRFVPTVEEAVRVPGLLGQKSRERAELTGLPVGVEVDGLVNQGADQRPIALATLPAERAQQLFQS